MNNNLRIRTDIGKDKYLKVNLEQDFDFLEILSLKISQEDVYRRFNANYGVVVGRVIVNNGLGVPNAKVSVFIPINDSESTNLKSLYPFKTINDKDSDGIRYNGLPKEYQSDCHTPVGTFPNKREVLDNDIVFEMYDKYYKFTTTTNDAGDFMLFGIPVGNHMLNVDVDLSDIGIFSQKPYDFIEQGNPEKLFKSPTVFLGGKNLNRLTQIKNQKMGVNVIPFWGEDDEIGISRIDVDLNYNLQPSAIFMGSIFGDNEKNSVNKNCRPRKDLGRLCETVSAKGTINMIRKDIDNNIEKFDIEGGKLIDEFGAWAYQIPMNLDYVVTDEFGELIPSEDTSKGIPTRAKVRFKVAMDDTGGDGRLRTRAKFLIPHNPTSVNDIDYNFDENTKDSSFSDLSWNKIYTVRNHITRTQANCSFACADNRRMIGIKDVDDCVGTKNPFPFNRLDGDFNPLFSIICIIMGIIITIVSILNGILRLINGIRIPVIKVFPFRGVKCVPLNCDGVRYAPNCSRRASPSGTQNRSGDDLHECYKILLAESLNVFEFDFYNDWINGTLFSFLLKYKKVKNNEKFCSVDRSESGFIVDTLGRGDLKSQSSERIYKGFIKKFNGELFYAPYDRDRDYLLYATDITSLGAINQCDWEGKPSFHEHLLPTTYKIPPLTNVDEPNVAKMADSKSSEALLFTFTCVSMKTNQTQINNIKRLCEIGVGLDEDRNDEPNGVSKDYVIDVQDIDDQFVRDGLIVANSNSLTLTTGGLNSDFVGSDYSNFRNFSNRTIKQAKGNSFYMYFGTSPNNSAVDKMNNKYFTPCEQVFAPPFIINGVVSDVTFLGGNDGGIDISIIGGSEPFTYSWDNGQITEDLNNLIAGEYTVTVIDDNGSTNKRKFTVREPSPIRVDYTTNTTSGPTNSDGSLCITSIIGGNGNYSVSLIGPTGNPTTIVVNNPQPNFCFTGLTVGTYYLNVSDSSTIPLTNDSVVEIVAPSLLTAVITFTSPFCYGPDDDNDAFIGIAPSGGTPPYTVVTSGPITGGTETYSSSLLNQYGLYEGNYLVTITDLFGQVVTGSGFIDIPLALEIEVSSNQVFDLGVLPYQMSLNNLVIILNYTTPYDLTNQNKTYYIKYRYTSVIGFRYAYYRFTPNSPSDYGVYENGGLQFTSSLLTLVGTTNSPNTFTNGKYGRIVAPLYYQANGFGNNQLFHIFKEGTVDEIGNFTTSRLVGGLGPINYEFTIPLTATAGDTIFITSERDGCESNKEILG